MASFGDLRGLALEVAATMLEMKAREIFNACACALTAVTGSLRDTIGTLRNHNVLKHPLAASLRQCSIASGFLPPQPTATSLTNNAYARLVAEIAMDRAALSLCIADLEDLAIRFVPFVSVLVTGTTTFQCAMHFFAG